MSLLPDEARLLFLAARPDAVAQETYVAALAASRPNWLAVGQLAEREKLMPVLWAYVKDHAALIPESVRGALRQQALVTEFRMTALESTLQTVVRELDGIGIRVMLLKGAALAKTVYGSFAQRPMGDVDILVAPGEAQRAWEHIRGLGWTLEYEGGQQFYGTFHHLPALVDPSALKLVLEIHRSMMPSPGPFTLNEAELWGEARPVSIGAVTAWVPSTHHQLLHLSVHFAWSHMFRGVGRTVRDVATLLTVESIDWAEFMELAGRAHANTSSYWTLSIAHALSGVQVPADVLEALRPRLPVAIGRMLERSYITTGLFDSCPSLELAELLWSAGIQPAASGHGQSRPWMVNRQFQDEIEGKRPVGFGARMTGQLRSGAKWWRFARTLTGRRRIL